MQLEQQFTKTKFVTLISLSVTVLIKTKMKKILLILLTISNFSNAQKLYFTASLGWGYGLFEKGYYTEENSSGNTSVQYQSKLSLSNFFAEPQTGYFLEYKINSKHTIGIGRMSGKTEHRISLKIGDRNGYTIFGGLYRKLGITYAYNLNRWNFQLGMFAANNGISTLPIGGTELISSTQDSFGYTSDSSYTSDFRVRKWGATTSLAIGYAIMNQKKNRERFRINLLLDIGWFRLKGVKDFAMYDYNRTLTSYSYSNGSQIKIYISKPILLYDFKKDKYKIFKSRA